MDSEVVLDADKINKRKSTCVNLVYARRPKKPKTTPVVAVLTPVAEPVNNNDPSSSGQSQPHENHENDKNAENGVVILKEQQQVPLVSLLDDRVKICLKTSTPKPEISDLKGKLEQELEQVKILHQKLEDKENEIEMAQQQQQQQQTVMVDAPVVYSHNPDRVYQQQQQQALQSPTLSQQYLTPPVTTFDRRSFSRDSSDTGRFRHLSVSVTDNEYLEKEKRTPKANHLYSNSDFLLGKDRLPPESNKRPKPTTGLERHKIQVFRSCSTLLQRLMKHKNGWVFNEPVNAKLLGLFDYHDFIKRPMDLGTIKSRLAQNFYKVPTEFAEDVRLTFNNALTYNPKGHEVYAMAEQLLNIFEEKWGVIESDWNYGLVQHNQRQFSHSQSPNFVNPVRSLDRSQSTMVLPRTTTIDRSQSTMVLPRPATIDRSQSMVVPRPATIAPSRRIPVPKKPKAREPNKRDMTYEEKKKLSSNLQSLPADHLDGVVQIIKKNNTLTQNDEEIEIEIDSVDIETLWELDRYVLNYKKNLSKVKRRAEIQQARALAGNNSIQNPVVSVPDAPNEKRADKQGPAPTSLNQGENENRGDNDTDSSSSSSDSSSSDSDSDSSSEEGSPRG